MAIMGGISAGIVAIIMAGATTATAIAIDAGDRRARMNAGGGVPPTLPSRITTFAPSSTAGLFFCGFPRPLAASGPCWISRPMRSAGAG
jgi:hypothetical protein